MTYDFEEKRAEGEAWGRVIDEYLRRMYDVEPVRAGDDRAGLDRLVRRLHGRAAAPIRVEYKADTVGGLSGNAFIETRSVDEKALGWLATSQADELLYYLPILGRAYRVAMPRLREAGLTWMDTFRTVSVPNAGYSTYGVIVPLAKVAEIADAVLTIPPTLDPSGLVQIEEFRDGRWQLARFHIGERGGVEWRGALYRVEVAHRIWPYRQYRVRAPKAVSSLVREEGVVYVAQA